MRDTTETETETEKEKGRIDDVSREGGRGLLRKSPKYERKVNRARRGCRAARAFCPHFERPEKNTRPDGRAAAGGRYAATRMRTTRAQVRGRSSVILREAA